MKLAALFYASVRRWFPWPKKLLGQMIILVLLALLLAQGISLWILSNAHRKILEDGYQHFLMRQVSSMVELLESTPANMRRNILHAWRRPGVKFKLLPHSRAGRSETEVEQVLTLKMEQWLGEHYSGRVRVVIKRHKRPFFRFKKKFRDHDRNAQNPISPAFSPSLSDETEDRMHKGKKPLFFASEYLHMDSIITEVKLNDGQWLTAKAGLPSTPPLAAKLNLVFIGVASILVLLVLIWRLRKITRPLAELTQSASRLGRGQKISQLNEQGPEDIKRTITAFNQMSERLDRFISDRTRMLAALSHDLRTPMTSMRLRLELMEEGPERTRLLASLDEMQQMSEAALQFIRKGADVEATSRVDIAALLSSICDDFTDTGMAVEFTCQSKIVLSCRSVSLKRALRNLIENAVKYGTSAQVKLSREDDNLVISIQDAGPGIPDTELQNVFQPFFRLEQSRNRETGGTGLGLSIAQQIINNHGGSIQLQNNEKGLLVNISLPLQ